MRRKHDVFYKKMDNMKNRECMKKKKNGYEWYKDVQLRR